MMHKTGTGSPGNKAGGDGDFRNAYAKGHQGSRPMAKMGKSGSAGSPPLKNMAKRGKGRDRDDRDNDG